MTAGRDRNTARAFEPSAVHCCGSARSRRRPPARDRPRASIRAQKLRSVARRSVTALARAARALQIRALRSVSRRLAPPRACAHAGAVQFTPRASDPSVPRYLPRSTRCARPRAPPCSCCAAPPNSRRPFINQSCQR
jgi:hypothetical protein